MRKLMMLMVITLSLLGIGCNETVVLEENTTVAQEIKEFEVTEVPIDLKEDFWPLKFIDDKLIVARSTYDYDNRQQYRSGFIDENGKIKDMNNEELVASEYGHKTIYGYYGISQEYDTKKEGSIREFYYRDILKDITIRLDGFNELTKKYRTSRGYIFEQRYLANNEKYYMLLISKYDPDDGSGLVEINTDEQMVIIIDIENKKMYYKKVDTFGENEGNDDNNIISNHSESRDNCVYSLYYDEEIESIMAITFSGKVKKVNLENGNIDLQEHRTLNLQGYELDDNSLEFGKSISSEDYVIRLKNPNDNSIIFGIYNSNSGEINLLEEGMYVTSELGKHDLVTISYKNEAYLAQIKEDYTVEFIYKFTDLTNENYKCSTAYAIMNNEGNRIFTVKTMYYGENLQEGFDNNKIRSDYSFIDLKSK